MEVRRGVFRSRHRAPLHHPHEAFALSESARRPGPRRGPRDVPLGPRPHVGRRPAARPAPRARAGPAARWRPRRHPRGWHRILVVCHGRPLGARMTGLPGQRDASPVPAYGIASWLAKRAFLDPRKVAVIEGGKRCTYAELGDRVTPLPAFLPLAPPIPPR